MLAAYTSIVSTLLSLPLGDSQRVTERGRAEGKGLWGQIDGLAGASGRPRVDERLGSDFQPSSGFCYEARYALASREALQRNYPTAIAIGQ